MKDLTDINSASSGTCPHCGKTMGVCATPDPECEPLHMDPVRGCADCDFQEAVPLDELNRLLGAPVLPGFEG